MTLHIPAGEFLFDTDPLLGRYRTYHIDPATHRHTITTHQLVANDANRARYNSTSDYGPSRWKGDWHHVASIPGNVLYALRAEGILDDDKAFDRWLNDPDNRVFRVKAGII